MVLRFWYIKKRFVSFTTKTVFFYFLQRFLNIAFGNSNLVSKDKLALIYIVQRSSHIAYLINEKPK